MDSKLTKLKKQADSTLDKTKNDTLIEQLSAVQSEYKRVTEISRAPMVLINDIEVQFQKATKLTPLDTKFLFVATALQMVRQLLTAFPERKSDSEAAKEVKGDTVEKSDRKHQYYKPSLSEIITNPVPYDASDGAGEYDALKGFGKLGHRGATPGHDPILGFIFGTANIATSTLTNWRMESYHITTGRRDMISARAKTPLVFEYTFDNLLHKGIEGKQKIGISLAKEYIHLKSDLYSKHSLPMPVISMISPKFAGELAHIGLDMANIKKVGQQALYAILINTMVSMIHGLLYDESSGISRRLYQVRTRKILSYSNLISSASNIVISACSQDIKKLDIGGLAVTLFRFISDTRFIADVKQEFLKEEFYDRIVGTEYDFLQGDNI